MDSPAKKDSVERRLRRFFQYVRFDEGRIARLIVHLSGLGGNVLLYAFRPPFAGLPVQEDGLGRVGGKGGPCGGKPQAKCSWKDVKNSDATPTAALAASQSKNPTIAEYEAYRVRLANDPLGRENYEFAQKEKFLLREDRTFLKRVFNAFSEVTPAFPYGFSLQNVPFGFLSSSERI